MRALPALARELAIVEGVFTDRGERIGLAFAEGFVLVGFGGEAGSDRSGEDFERGCVQLAFDFPAAIGELRHVQLVDLRLVVGGGPVLVELVDELAGERGELVGR